MSSLPDFGSLSWDSLPKGDGPPSSEESSLETPEGITLRLAEMERSTLTRVMKVKAMLEAARAS